MAIEEVLSSRGRVKILKILADIGELNISDIARRAGLNYTVTNRHLIALERYGLILHKKFGRIRIYRYNENNPKAEMIRKLVDLWEQTK